MSHQRCWSVKPHTAHSQTDLPEHVRQRCERLRRQRQGALCIHAVALLALQLLRACLQLQSATHGSRKLVNLALVYIYEYICYGACNGRLVLRKRYCGRTEC
jgi:hypothetical protein